MGLLRTKGGLSTFETLFRYPAIIARHRAGPFVEARERFLRHCAGRGFAHATLQRYAQEILIIAERVDINASTDLEAAITGAADIWSREQHKRHRVQSLRWSRELFVNTATEWLQFLGHLAAPKPKTLPFAEQLADFAAYRRNERGLSPATVRVESWHAGDFLGWLSNTNRCLATVCLEDVDTFL